MTLALGDDDRCSYVKKLKVSSAFVFRDALNTREGYKKKKEKRKKYRTCVRDGSEAERNRLSRRLCDTKTERISRFKS